MLSCVSWCWASGWLYIISSSREDAERAHMDGGVNNLEKNSFSSFKERLTRKFSVSKSFALTKSRGTNIKGEVQGILTLIDTAVYALEHREEQPVGWQRATGA